MAETTEGELLWSPSAARRVEARVTDYVHWLRARRNLDLTDPFDDASAHALWQWSVSDLDAFWASIWDYFDVQGTPASEVLAGRAMPGAKWFPGAELNYAEHIFRGRDPSGK